MGGNGIQFIIYYYIAAFRFRLGHFNNLLKVVFHVQCRLAVDQKFSAAAITNN